MVKAEGPDAQSGSVGEGDLSQSDRLDWGRCIDEDNWCSSSILSPMGQVIVE